MKRIVVLLTLLEGFICDTELSSCCNQIFLQSSGIVGSSSSGALGIYTISNQKLANTPHPVYAKLGEDRDYHIYYRKKPNGPQGWIVGGDLLEDSFYITTGQSEPECPEGIVGGIPANNQTAFDKTFSIECHTDQVKIPCCGALNISAEGALLQNQGGSLGVYTQTGDFNGHPVYKGGYQGNHLFYRKSGSGPDGWVISPQIDENMLMLTTRQKDFCPDTIVIGYDRDINIDNTLNIICTVQDDSQDPGVPTVPLGEPIHGDALIANTAVLNMVSFRIFTILYLLVIQQ